MEPEIPYAGQVPLVPNVRPVIVVSGSGYDMGYQHFQQIIQVFGPFYIRRLMHSKFSEKQIASLKATQWYIKKEAPEIVDYLKGMVAGTTDAGVPLSYKDVLAFFAGTDFYPTAPYGSKNEELPPPDCSGFAAWGRATKDGRLICGGSGDHDLYVPLVTPFEPEYTIMYFPDKGNNFICSPPTGGAGHPAMNNKGVAYVHHGCTGYFTHMQKPGEPNWGYGAYCVPFRLALLHALRFANTANEAGDILLSMHTTRGGLWADTKGNAFDIENRDDPRCIRKPGDNGEVDFIYATNNLWSKELAHVMGGAQFVPHAGWLNSDQPLGISSIGRNLGLWNMLHHYNGEVDLNFAMMMYRFPGKQPSYPTLEAADESYYKTKGAGWHEKICDLENAMVGVLVPDDGDKGLYYVSQGCAARITSPLFPGGHYYRIAPTYSFYQLTLASTPEKVVEGARARAQYDLYYANLELRKLNYGDCAYAPLDAIFNEAATEWQKGEFYRLHAKETEGNDSVHHYGRAVRAFARCQALANKVHHSLVPPPDSPEDLGLRPWQYWSRE